MQEHIAELQHQLPPFNPAIVGKTKQEFNASSPMKQMVSEAVHKITSPATMLWYRPGFDIYG